MGSHRYYWEQDRADEERSHTMSPLRMLRRKSTLAYVILAISLLYLFGDRISTILGLSAGSAVLEGPPLGEPGWNLLYHLGGNGPWIKKYTDHGMVGDDLPLGCKVDQLHMMSRHAERYPTRNAGNRHLELLARLQAPGIKLQDSLAFLKDWTYFTNPKDPAFEDLTRHGRYAGTQQAEDTGAELRTRYGHLVQEGRKVRFWTCSSGRDVETARFFANGFFGSNWENKGLAELEIIPEDDDRGGNTLTPGDTCLNYVNDLKEGHDKGYGKLEGWQKIFTRPIPHRLSEDASGVKLNHLDIYSMMEMCGFEMLARGSSPWCDVFSHDEWLQFEYARDLLHFYRAGPGNKYSRAMGWLYLNATAELLSNNSAQDTYFSFVHDGDIVPLLAALRLLDENGPQELPVDKVKEPRNWRTSDVVPMGGRILFERIACDPGQQEPQRYVRLSVNDGVVRLPGVPESPILNSSMLVSDFKIFVEEKLSEYGEFAEVCGLPDGAATRIRFLHQP
jgi:acid phosphatase